MLRYAEGHQQSSPAMDFGNCFESCATKGPPCYAACEKSFPDGIVGVGAALACFDIECKAAGLCPNDPTDDCTACTDTKCSCELVNCETDADCFSINQCVAACTTVACAKSCTQGVPAAGLALYETYAACTHPALRAPPSPEGEGSSVNPADSSALPS